MMLTDLDVSNILWWKNILDTVNPELVILSND